MGKSAKADRVLFGKPQNITRPGLHRGVRISQLFAIELDCSRRNELFLQFAIRLLLAEA